MWNVGGLLLNENATPVCFISSVIVNNPGRSGINAAAGLNMGKGLEYGVNDLMWPKTKFALAF